VTAQAAADHRTAHTASGSRSPHTNERAEDGTMKRDLPAVTAGAGLFPTEVAGFEFSVACFDLRGFFCAPLRGWNTFALQHWVSNFEQTAAVKRKKFHS
jgi:hypothetical protein